MKCWDAFLYLALLLKREKRKDLRLSRYFENDDEFILQSCFFIANIYALKLTGKLIHEDCVFYMNDHGVGVNMVYSMPSLFRKVNSLRQQTIQTLVTQDIMNIHKRLLKIVFDEFKIFDTQKISYFIRSLDCVLKNGKKGSFIISKEDMKKEIQANHFNEIGCLYKEVFQKKN